MKKYILALFVFMIISACNGSTNYKKMEIMGPSMEPTFKDGQIVKVDTDYYNQHEVERNELVCFYTDQKNKMYVKRVVGLPNEKIKVMKDRILINDVPIDLPVKMVDNSRVGEYKTGADDFFIIGDNYNDSLDSRTIGTIRKEQIVGKVID
ncbi:signal peptidase I [Paenibacillus sp. sgz5001063]|uniref:signal peptidase I n=1 Tax=Paenibacillus sp. sgz5001063 TaxID=3242474 RepID=UPI0036D21987